MRKSLLSALLCSISAGLSTEAWSQSAPAAVKEQTGAQEVRFEFVLSEDSDWLASGMSEHEVMILAGHASFNTTHRFYLAVATDLVDRARVVSDQVLCQDLLRTCCAPTILPQNEKGLPIVNDCQPSTYSNGQGRI